MEQEIFAHVMKLKSLTGQPFEVKVDGSSMLPVILPTDTVVVLKSKDYAIGDILLFLYEDHHIIIHRLLKIIDGVYYCKGDNSFRLEMIQYTDIFGKVLTVKRQDTIVNLPSMPRKYLEMSYWINQEFVKNECNIQQTKNTSIYLKYKEEYLEGYLAT